ncbi:MAG: pyruvate kinase [Candidatus Omnitrophica bacterium]|nr:pyruvate kinase [Candidatus Omnitrophota bacterium]
MDFKVIVTVGDALMGNPEKLLKIYSMGECILRINGAHIGADKISSMVQTLRDILKGPRLMLDLPGNKVRTRGLSDPIRLSKGEDVLLHAYQVNYPRFFTLLTAGDIMLANDSNICLEVRDVNPDTVKLLSHSNGILDNNKGIHVRGIHKDIPFLFEKDIRLIGSACSEGLDYISLSYVRTRDDIVEAKKLIKGHAGRTPAIIAKIETAEAVENLGYIFKEVDRINIDRGDLSADIGMLKVPAVQERVIESARRAGKEVFLATQFFKNMEQYPVPLIAEVMDFYKTVKTGISGIQLSEETAVGKYPVECVKLVFDVYNQSFSG